MSTDFQDTPATAASFDAFDPSEELDLTSAGFQTPLQVWTITQATAAPAANAKGRGIQAELEFSTAGPAGGTISVTERYWLRHQDAQMQQIGQGQIKRVFLAAFGRPTGSIPALAGRSVLAQGGEDKQGFRRVKGIRPADGQTGLAQPVLTSSIAAGLPF